MRKVNSLKKLNKKLTGTEVVGETVSEVLENMDTPKEILIKSSTPNSSKVFKITVVDAGTLTATEVV